MTAATEARYTALRAAAEGGDLVSAREYARLAALLRDEDQDAAEKRLRDLSQRLPGDPPATHLLAAHLLRGVVATVEDFSYRPHDASPELDRSIAEITGLYQGLLTRDPRDGVARAGLAALRELRDEGGEQHVAPAYECCWYVMERETGSGSVEFLQRLVVTDPDELRWACERWAGTEEGYWDQGYLTLTSYEAGVAADRIDLAEHADAEGTDWDAVEIPSLTGIPLPAGRPVRVEGGGLAHHGYFEHIS